MRANESPPIASPRGWRGRGYLPHFDTGAGLAQFVTFRLADSVPQNVIERWQAERLVEQALLFFAGVRYSLHSWVIMPNHVHVLFTLLESWSLSSVVASWKSFTAKQANAALNRTGRFWQEDYFDRYVRNEYHFDRVIEYIERNPVKAGLCDDAAG